MACLPHASYIGVDPSHCLVRGWTVRSVALDQCLRLPSQHGGLAELLGRSAVVMRAVRTSYRVGSTVRRACSCRALPHVLQPSDRIMRAAASSGWVVCGVSSRVFARLATVLLAWRPSLRGDGAQDGCCACLMMRWRRAVGSSLSARHGVPCPQLRLSCPSNDSGRARGRKLFLHSTCG